MSRLHALTAIIPLDRLPMEHRAIPLKSTLNSNAIPSCYIHQDKKLGVKNMEVTKRKILSMASELAKTGCLFLLQLVVAYQLYTFNVLFLLKFLFNSTTLECIQLIARYPFFILLYSITLNWYICRSLCPFIVASILFSSAYVTNRLNV